MGIAGLWFLIQSFLSPSFDILDDRGKPLASPVQVCWTRELAQTCEEVPAGGAARVPVRCDGLRIEGAEHGPAAWSPCPSGSSNLVVPRKSRLEIAGLPVDSRAVLSLYSVTDEEFRRPAHRYEVAGDPARPWIPAGDWVLSIAAAGHAPDLRIVTMPPGGAQRIAHRPRRGWSALVRAHDALGRKPVTGARLRFAPSFLVPEAETLPRPEAETDRFGLAIVSGLTGTPWSARIDSPSHLPTSIEAILAAPETFAFETVELSRGASLEATVTIDGVPAAGAGCRIYDPRANDESRPAAIVEWARVTAGADGICRASRLPPGRTRLEITPRGKSGEPVVRRRIDLVEGESARRVFPLETIRVTGKVRRGERGLEGWRVLFLDRTETVSGNLEPPVATASTDEEGEFEVTLWQGGDFYVSLRDPRDTPAGSRMPSLSPPEERIDFDLAPEEIHGRVVTASGEAVAGARVVLVWQSRSWRLGTSAADGSFSFPIDTNDGEGKLQAHHPRYRSSREISFRFQPGVALPPIELELDRRSVFAGRLLTASGAPAPGVEIQGFDRIAGQPPAAVGVGTTGDDGRFELPVESRSQLRLFAHGPGCPLTGLDLPAQESEEEAELRCVDLPAALKLEVRDARGFPVAGLPFLVRYGGAELPAGVLEPYLARFGLATVTDGAGRLVLPGLPPGRYELFTGTAASAVTIAAGSASGHVATVDLAPGAVTELAVEVVIP